MSIFSFHIVKSIKLLILVMLLAFCLRNPSYIQGHEDISLQLPQYSEVFLLSFRSLKVLERILV